jgi:hypothetical protein
VSFRIEKLPNGFIRVDERGSGLTGMYELDGSHRHGVRFRELTPAVLQRELGRQDARAGLPMRQSLRVRSESYVLGYLEDATPTEGGR